MHSNINHRVRATIHTDGLDGSIAEVVIDSTAGISLFILKTGWISISHVNIDHSIAAFAVNADICLNSVVVDMLQTKSWPTAVCWIDTLPK